MTQNPPESFLRIEDFQLLASDMSDGGPSRDRRPLPQKRIIAGGMAEGCAKGLTSKSSQMCPTASLLLAKVWAENFDKKMSQMGVNTEEYQWRASWIS